MFFLQLVVILLQIAAINSYDLHPGDSSYWCTNCLGPQFADTLLTYQRPSGGWPKNENPQPGDVYTGTEIEGCLDNGATVDEIRFMAQAYKEMDNELYKNSAVNGLDFIFDSQHTANSAGGGWPQFFPLIGGYKDAITFNDNLHINVMKLLDELNAHTLPFDIEPFSTETRTQDALERGMECILATQIQITGLAGCPTRTNWCAQHNRFTLDPIAARDYEPVSYSGNEGMKIALYLMDIASPSVEIKDAIVGAYVWTKKSVLLDYAKEMDTNDNKILVYSEGATLWPRFATIPHSSPIFCDRGCVNDDSLMYNDYPVGYSQLDPERRNGYTWLGNWGSSVISKFETEWQPQYHPDYVLNLDCLAATFAPTTSPTPQPSPSVACEYGECIDRCIAQYGGDGTSGESYMCSKGCAGMSSGEITNPNKFCDVEPASDRYDVCVTSCEGASGSESNRAICRWGCEFWIVAGTAAPTTAPTSSPSRAPTGSPTKVPSLTPTSKPTGVSVPVTKYICSKNAPSDNKICAEGTLTCSSCGGQKSCHSVECSGGGDNGPTTTPPPTPTGGGCPVCAPTTQPCCEATHNCVDKGNPDNRGCIPLPSTTFRIFQN